MTVQISPIAVAAGLALLLVSGCSGFRVPEDPCAQANRPVTFENLLENSVLENYERCLQETRAEAVDALE